jgi:hypothetical protein
MADTESGTFNPSRYLTKVSGSDYLEVKWRVLWLRTEHPDAEIETEMTTFSGEQAVFRARVSIPGGGSATGWGSETYNDFRDFVEKAETKALGRALAALGFGTQFCDDFVFGAHENRIVDSPVNVQARSAPVDRDRFPPVREQRPQGGGTQPATSKQLQFISSIARELNITDESLELEAQSSFAASVVDLSRRDASILIERLQQRRQQTRPVGAQP